MLRVLSVSVGQDGCTDGRRALGGGNQPAGQSRNGPVGSTTDPFGVPISHRQPTPRGSERVLKSILA
jgi:hypothetical protein